MLIFENREKAIYNFNLSIEQEAQLLYSFVDSDNMLLFPYLECNFTNFPQDREFIEQRTRFKSSERVFEITNEDVRNKTIYWYEAVDLNDLEYILWKDRITYRCIVAPRIKQLIDWRFKLFVYEHAIYKDEETRVLWVEEKKENDYVNQFHNA